MKHLFQARSAVVAAVGVAVALLAACAGPSTAWRTGSGSSTGPGTPSSSAAPSATGQPVHVRLYQSDGSTYGVGIPIIAYLSAAITDAKAFAKATQVTVTDHRYRVPGTSKSRR